MQNRSPVFSVIIPTRNRPALFRTALNSVLEQRYRSFEVIIINDGSAEEHASRYDDMVKVAPAFVRMLTLVAINGGHGPGYARNYGAAHARGDFLSFLDDDDQWIDPNHLNRTARVITASTVPIDLIFANQLAFRNGTPVPAITWIEDLAERLRSPPDPAGAFVVTPAELLGCQAHCHLNTTIARRSFFFEVGGFDEGLRYEEDRDFYLRAIDNANTIKFLPTIVSRHNIPNPGTKASASTLNTEISNLLFQLRVFDKAALFSARSEVRCYAVRHRAYILKRIAIRAAEAGRVDSAGHYAREALVTSSKLSWLGAAALFALRRLFPDMAR